LKSIEENAAAIRRGTAAGFFDDPAWPHSEPHRYYLAVTPAW